ncbi:mechanosensitive ion channel family protein [Tropicimonas sp. IMCC34043]|uniref:mechanosensitive ion channel family protein n=1 Tax=Tropicimonas sp. IMCC34043 TaxID=2248760 RepID=UPI000E2440DA|nr:mechanosensitive ion channel family protein [Tropicimonas sp. IMCC34043]
MRAIVYLFLTLFLALSLPAPVTAETGELTVPINRSSPRDTYQSFLAATGRVEEGYADYVADKTTAKVHSLRRQIGRIRRLMDLSALPPSTRVKVGNAAVGYLYDILARLPPLDPASIPGTDTPAPAASRPDGDSAAAPSSWTIPGTDIQIAYVATGPHSGNYLFTAESIANFPEYYREVSANDVLNPRLYDSFHTEQMNATGPLISEDFVASLPAALKTSYFDTPAWKILAIIGIIFAVLVIALLWTLRAFRRARGEPPLRRYMRHLTVPAMVLVLLQGSKWFVAAQINPAGTFAASELMIATLVWYATVAWLAWLLIHFAVETVILSPRIPNDSYDANLLRLTARIVSFVSVGTILTIGADRVGIPALGLVAGLGVGGFAVALASQSTLENLFGGLSLFADRPFRIGDSILIGGQSATAERIGPRSSRLRARDGTLWTVPNADLARMHIVNYTQRDGCYLDLTLAVKDSSAPETIERLLVQVRALFEASDLIEKKEGWPRIYAVDVLPGQIRVRLQARVQTVDFHVFLAEQERILLSVLGMMRELGIELAAPVPLMQETAAGAR